MQDGKQNKKDELLLTAWNQFAQTGKICDYLNYCAQDKQLQSDGEGTETYAGDSEWVGNQGENPQQ